MYFSQFWRRPFRGQYAGRFGSWRGISSCLCPRTLGRSNGSLGFPCKGTSLTARAPPLLPNYLPKTPTPNTITRRIVFQHTNFGQTHSVYSPCQSHLLSCAHYAGLAKHNSSMPCSQLGPGEEMDEHEALVRNSRLSQGRSQTSTKLWVEKGFSAHRWSFSTLNTPSLNSRL